MDAVAARGVLVASRSERHSDFNISNPSLTAFTTIKVADRWLCYPFEQLRAVLENAR